MTPAGNTADRKLITRQWIHCLLHLLVVVGVGAFLIPFFRSNPQGVHDFANGLTAWQRVLFTFLLCVLFVHFMFKLFSPRLPFAVRQASPSDMARVDRRGVHSGTR